MICTRVTAPEILSGKIIISISLCLADLKSWELMPSAGECE